MEGSYSSPAQTQHLTPLYGSPSFPLLQLHHGCSPVPRHCHRICSWVENPVFLPSTPSSFPISRLNAYLGAPSPNIHHSCLPAANRTAGDPVGSESSEPRGAEPGGSGAAGHSPPGPAEAQPRPDSAQAGAGGLGSQLPLPALPRGSGSMCDSWLPALLPESPAGKESSETDRRDERCYSPFAAAPRVLRFARSCSMKEKHVHATAF